MWLIAMLVLAACQAPPPAAQNGTIASTPLDHLPALRGDYFKHVSRAVGRLLHIYVAFPESYTQRARARYPVVYLLDGDSLFPIHATHHWFLHYDEGVPEAIVVGIAYGSFDPSVNKRGYDFSAAASDASKEQGGASAFHAFLETELLPEIDRRYRTDPDRRVLFGQSRAGYMVLYSAFTDPDLFWGRIASIRHSIQAASFSSPHHRHRPGAISGSSSPAARAIAPPVAATRSSGSTPGEDARMRRGRSRP